MPDYPRSTPHRDTVYRESVKQAWREEDQAQRDARLNYVTTLGNVHQTSEAAQAAAVLTYQQARAAASRIEQDARAALRVDFNKQQASTFADETAGWLTSAPTPWHKQLASQADAESTYRAVEQDASLLQQRAEHAAKENYLADRETARATLRTDRAATSAAEAFTEQQNLENEHEYGDEYYDDHDPYQNVTVDLPTGLNYDDSSDPEGVSHTLDDDPFSGQFSLGGTFGSQIGGGPDGTDEYGTYFSEYTQYDLANQRADQVRGDAFAANNPLGALGRSDAQANSTQTVNWGVSPRNQQTNEQPPTQIAGLDAGESPEWESDQQLAFANGDGPAFGSDFGSYGDSATMSDKVLYYELYDDNGTPNNEADDIFLGYREDHFSGFSLFGGSSPSKSIYTDPNGNVVNHIDADREVLGYGQDASRPGDGLPEKPDSDTGTTQGSDAAMYLIAVYYGDGPTVGGMSPKERQDKLDELTARRGSADNFKRLIEENNGAAPLSHYRKLLQTELKIIRALEQELAITKGYDHHQLTQSYIDGLREQTELQFWSDITTATVDSGSAVTPYASDYRDFYEAWHGEDLVDPDVKLTPMQRAATIGLALLPFVSAAALRKLLKKGADEVLDTGKIDGISSPNNTSRNSTKGLEDADNARFSSDIPRHPSQDGNLPISATDEELQQAAEELFADIATNTNTDIDQYIDSIEFSPDMGVGKLGSFSVDPRTGKRKIKVSRELMESKSITYQRITAMHELFHAKDWNEYVGESNLYLHEAREFFFVSQDRLPYITDEISAEWRALDAVTEVYEVSSLEIDESVEYILKWVKRITNDSYYP